MKNLMYKKIKLLFVSVIMILTGSQLQGAGVKYSDELKNNFNRLIVTQHMENFIKPINNNTWDKMKQYYIVGNGLIFEGTGYRISIFFDKKNNFKNVFLSLDKDHFNKHVDMIKFIALLVNLDPEVVVKKLKVQEAQLTPEVQKVDFWGRRQRSYKTATSFLHAYHYEVVGNKSFAFSIRKLYAGF
jgi:hypothetical protein